MKTVHSLPFSTVLVVDDDAQSREGYGYSLVDMGLSPVYQADPIPSDISTFVSHLRSRAGAVFSDFRLTTQPNYASQDGDALVAACNQKQIPAVLCTTYTDVDAHLNRMFLRHIPALLRRNDPDPALLESAFMYCCREIRGEFRPARRPWRTLVRVNDVDRNAAECHVIIPARNVSEKIALNLHDLPKSIRPLIEPGVRLHAEVNVGAEAPNDIYFDKWEAS